MVIRRSRNTDVNLLLADDRGVLVVADVAVKSLCTQYRSRERFKYDHQLNLDRTNVKKKSLEDVLSRTVKVGDSLVIDLTRRDLEHEACER